MTPAQRIDALVSDLSQLAAPSHPEIERIVGVPLAKVKENKYFEFFAAEDAGAPLADVDLRIKKDGSGKGLLVLGVAEEARVSEEELALSRFGLEPRLSVNPEIPPEGTVDLAYGLDLVEARFQLTAKSRTLRLIAFEWGLSS